jgi:hypothetical protein
MLFNGNMVQDKEIKQNATTQLLVIPNGQFQSASNNGRTTGRSVSCLKGTTWKGIKTATS